MTKPTIGGNLDEMLERVRENKIKNEEEEKKVREDKIKNEEEEKKLEEMILLKNEIIMELDQKYHFDRMCLSIEKFNDILPSLIDYIDAPNPKLKKSLLKKINTFIECYNNL